MQFEILKTVLNLGEKNDKGWIKQVNLVKWNGKNPVYDIRKWHYTEDGIADNMSKGISLQDNEWNTLVDFIQKGE